MRIGVSATMFTKTSEYALRAMTWITQQGPSATVSGPKIAAETGVPRKYLSMIFGSLVRQGLLRGTVAAWRWVRNDLDAGT